jgi:hypothetical protein
VGEVEQLLGDVKDWMVVGVYIERDGDESNTSPFTEGSAEQVSTFVSMASIIQQYVCFKIIIG